MVAIIYVHAGASDIAALPQCLHGNHDSHRRQRAVASDITDTHIYTSILELTFWHAVLL